MKNKQGNLALMAIIIVCVAITAGIVGWKLANNLQKPVPQATTENFPSVKLSDDPTKPTEEIIGDVQTQPLTQINSAGSQPVKNQQTIIPKSTPTEKLVMCFNSCQKGTPVPENMVRHPGETVQKIRACFGSVTKQCPDKDVTSLATWSVSDGSVLDWTRDFTAEGKVIADQTYPKKTLKVKYIGSAKAIVQYAGYSDSLQVDSQQVQ